MRVLILNKKANGIINLKEEEYFVLDEITEFGQVLRKLTESKKNYFDYKYCVLEENQFIPFFMKTKTKLINQMEEFDFERVRFSELNIEEADKEKIITEMVKTKSNANIKTLEEEVLTLIVKRELGENIEKRINKIKDKFDKIEKELKNIDYKKFLNEFV
jgi:exonuclease VII large subunit